jgi:hypothetical protein
LIFGLFLDTRNRGENKVIFGVILLLSQYIAKKIICPGFYEIPGDASYWGSLCSISCFGKDLVRLLHNHKP